MIDRIGGFLDTLARGNILRGPVGAVVRGEGARKAGEATRKEIGEAVEAIGTATRPVGDFFGGLFGTTKEESTEETIKQIEEQLPPREEFDPLYTLLTQESPHQEALMGLLADTQARAAERDELQREQLEGIDRQTTIDKIFSPMGEMYNFIAGLNPYSPTAGHRMETRDPREGMALLAQAHDPSFERQTEQAILSGLLSREASERSASIKAVTERQKMAQREKKDEMDKNIQLLKILADPKIDRPTQEIVQGLLSQGLDGGLTDLDTNRRF